MLINVYNDLNAPSHLAHPLAPSPLHLSTLFRIIPQISISAYIHLAISRNRFTTRALTIFHLHANRPKNSLKFGNLTSNAGQVRLTAHTNRGVKVPFGQSSASLRLCARLFPDIHSLEIARSHISYTDQIPPHCASLSKHVPLVPSVLSLPPNQAAAARCAST